METSITPATEGQKKQIVQVVTDTTRKAVAEAVEKADLTKEGAQHVLGNGDEVVAAVLAAAVAAIKNLSIPNQFADEERASSYGYPQGWRIKSIAEQATVLAKFFPGLDVSHAGELAKRYEKDDKLVLPEGMDGLAVIPKHSAIARLTTGTNENWPAYNRALAHLLGVVKSARPEFVDYTDGAVGPDCERLAPKTAAVYAEMENVPGDVVVLAAQTGLLHRGKSVRRARVVFGAKEFGLDSFVVGCIILTHPERLNDPNVLWIDCAGSERAPRAGDAFAGVSYWSFDDGRLEFSSDRISPPNGDYGSASGVRPE